MSDIELTLSADLGAAIKNVGAFRKEYQELVKAVEKPLRQVEGLRKPRKMPRRPAPLTLRPASA